MQLSDTMWAPKKTAVMHYRRQQKTGTLEAKRNKKSSQEGKMGNND